MTDNKPPRGAAPVGHLADLGAIEAGAVLYLRMWCEGAAAQQRIRRDFANHLGPAAGAQALQDLGALCLLCLHHGRRPLMRHDVTCTCLGADEACFATFIAAATEGEREDAIMIATLLVRADMAMSLCDLGAAFGLSLKRLSLSARRAPTPPLTLH